MKVKLDFDAAKEKVAERHGFRNWGLMFRHYLNWSQLRDLDGAIKEVAELMAQSWANHYVKEDRQFWVQNDQAGGLCGRSDTELIKDRWYQINTVPLPFPEEP